MYWNVRHFSIGNIDVLIQNIVHVKFISHTHLLTQLLWDTLQWVWYSVQYYSWRNHVERITNLDSFFFCFSWQHGRYLLSAWRKLIIITLAEGFLSSRIILNKLSGISRNIVHIGETLVWSEGLWYGTLEPDRLSIRSPGILESQGLTWRENFVGYLSSYDIVVTVRVLWEVGRGELLEIVRIGEGAEGLAGRGEGERWEVTFAWLLETQGAIKCQNYAWSKT